MLYILPRLHILLIKRNKVKPNVGHSEGAAGLTSLIKGVLSLEQQTIPPNIKFDTPNPKSEILVLCSRD